MKDLQLVVNGKTVFTISRSSELEVDYNELTSQLVDETTRLKWLNQPVEDNDTTLCFKHMHLAAYACMLWNNLVTAAGN